MKSKDTNKSKSKNNNNKKHKKSKNKNNNNTRLRDGTITRGKTTIGKGRANKISITQKNIGREQEQEQA